LRSSDYPLHVYGVDFSGAAQAGKRIWVTRGVIQGDALRIEACWQGADLPDSGSDRDRCLVALRDFIAKEQTSAFGLDFPFGLPCDLVKESSWEDFVLAFADHYPTPEAFRDACRAAAAGSEWKRITDRESHTPFSPYNIRLYRQTYFGIRDVIAPLVREGLAYVLPMQPARQDRPWLMEVCPASTLKREYLYWSPYKGKSKEHHRARARILEALEGTLPLSVATPLRSVILDNAGGDALDSVVAAFAAFRALCNWDNFLVGGDDVYGLEGYVYV
jgi:hypothetical protein